MLVTGRPKNTEANNDQRMFEFQVIHLLTQYRLF